MKRTPVSYPVPGSVESSSAIGSIVQSIGFPSKSAWAVALTCGALRSTAGAGGNAPAIGSTAIRFRVTSRGMSGFGVGEPDFEVRESSRPGGIVIVPPVLSPLIVAESGGARICSWSSVQSGGAQPMLA